VRARAIVYVAGLVSSYRAALRVPRLPLTGVTFYHERIRALTRELAELQGSDGIAHARRWAKVTPL